MPPPIKCDPGTPSSRLPSSAAEPSSNLPSSHPIQQLEQVIMKAEDADPPGRARDLLRPIQETIKVREQHYEDCLKEKDAQVLALKLELSNAKLSAKEMDENLLAVRGELRGAKRDICILKSQAQEYEKKILELETEKLGWAEGNVGKFEQLEAARADLQSEVASLSNTVIEQKKELFDLRVKGIAQSGEIHFLKKDIEALRNDLELKREAADWLVHNGPSLQQDFHRMRDEITELKTKGAEMASLMTSSARKWKSAVAHRGNVGMERDDSGAVEQESSLIVAKSNRVVVKRRKEADLDEVILVHSLGHEKRRHVASSSLRKDTRHHDAELWVEDADPYVGIDDVDQVGFPEHRKKRMSLLQLHLANDPSLARHIPAHYLP
ncbi:hypothetical protein DL98DRAFT_119120 [Cadophora sp. DSE1049]|nr:hypothetical protein DL98DRAFT_119120 [Cadophora sp. DSE1049]